MNRRKVSQANRRFAPEDLLTFIELKPFTRLWERLELSDDTLLQLQIAIMNDPLAAPVIPDCTGVRKLRFAPSSSGKGKSGGLRCCYKYFEEHQIVVLAIVYPKSLQENLTVEEKRRIREAIHDIESTLSHRLGRLS